jgi:mannose-6-phosphate isomerase-like protein (cupin superfamily)
MFRVKLYSTPKTQVVLMSIAIDVPVDGRLRWFVGSLNRIVATAAETAGRFGLMEQWTARGFSPPLHVHHREDSALVILEGEMLVQRGNEEVLAGPGECVFLPRDVPHTFLVISDTAHFYELVTPGGFESYHLDASDPAPAAVLPLPDSPDIGRLVAALVSYGAEILGPPLHATER